MKKQSIEVNFWKFVAHPVSTTEAQAAEIARRIATREIVPVNNNGERFYKVGGWCYDVGRKPFLVEHQFGPIQRYWARTITELRKACRLAPTTPVVRDPFYRASEDGLHQAA